jgi:hypothetical protein
MELNGTESAWNQGNYSPFTRSGTANSGLLSYWSGNGAFYGPSVGKYSGSSPLNLGGSPNLIIPNDVLTMGPGQNPNIVVTLWTAPASGFYDITGSFTNLQQFSGAVNVVIGQTNGTDGSEYGQTLGAQFSYLNQYLPAGSTVGFIVDSLGSQGNDVVGLKATISSVPAPAALLLFGPGLVGLAAIRRRFKG